MKPQTDDEKQHQRGLQRRRDGTARVPSPRADHRARPASRPPDGATAAMSSGLAKSAAPSVNTADDEALAGAWAMDAGQTAARRLCKEVDHGLHAGAIDRPNRARLASRPC